MGPVNIDSEFTVVQWNARSLCGYAMQHKKAEFYDFLMTFKKLPEVVCIQETWNKQSQNLIKLMGCKEPVSYRRKEANGGGVATFVRQGLDSEEIKCKQNNPNLEVAIVRIFGTNKNTDIINIYTNGDFMISKSDFDNVLAHVGKHHVIVGDFNVRDSLWDSQYLGGGDTSRAWTSWLHRSARTGGTQQRGRDPLQFRNRKLYCHWPHTGLPWYQ